MTSIRKPNTQHIVCRFITISRTDSNIYIYFEKCIDAVQPSGYDTTAVAVIISNTTTTVAAAYGHIHDSSYSSVTMYNNFTPIDICV